MAIFGIGVIFAPVIGPTSGVWITDNWTWHRRRIAAVALVAVVFWELRVDDPVVNFRMLKDRNFALACGLMYVVGFMLYGSTMLLPVLLQTMLGYTATLSGLVLSPGGIVVGFLMPLVGVLVGRVQPRWLIVVGLVFSAAGLFG